MSSHLETGVLQRDSRVWLHPKRCLACPLGRLPMKPNGARRRRRMDVLRRGTLLRSGQYANCAKRHSVSSLEAKPWALCFTRMRVNAQEEKRKHGITCRHMSRPLEKSRAEGTLLRSGQYGNCAKRYFVSSFRAKREIFVIRGLTVNDCKFQTGNLLSTYLRASPHIYCSEAATTTLNPEP